jgi:hypothetical protein
MIDEDSPLRFLDMDVSRYIYETYYPPEINKQWKQLVMDQLKHHYKIFTNNKDNHVLINYDSPYLFWKYVHISHPNTKLFLEYINYKKRCKNVR